MSEPQSTKTDPSAPQAPSDSDNGTTTDNIQQIQAECSQMISMLKQMEQKEEDLDCQLEILAREAMLCGFQPEKVEKVLLRKPPAKKRKKAETPAATNAGKGATPAQAPSAPSIKNEDTAP